MIYTFNGKCCGTHMIIYKYGFYFSRLWTTYITFLNITI